jgi:hypothetical protein
MNQILQITNDFKQKAKVILINGSPMTLNLRFSPMQAGWFADISYIDFTLNGLRICNSPNILHQYRNQIPFGLGCFSVGQREPSLQDDFSSNSSKLYLLTSDDTLAFYEYLIGV